MSEMELINMDKETARRVLTDEFHMRKISVKVVPNVISDDQKHCHKDVCMCGQVRTHYKRAKFVVACDDTYNFTYDPENNPRSMK
ncbi:hypothetical protein TNIN_319031 [Trichonephila inaurata madagascariensis]|uniref:Uncharacterized protein n=1 Tax=Trichonephila inaurata madagascariensis TaxID=2747483 RepID=A0A8X6MIX5_9ARAC|nr:hypothetical protein TNIN_319031 [Trichonephila inaurata madagascariensis]